MAESNLQGEIIRKEIEEFGKLNQGVHPSKLPDNEFTVKENLVNRIGSYGSPSRRGALRLYQNDVLNGGTPALNLFEGRFASGYKLLGKNSGGQMEYVDFPYTTAGGTWQSVSTTETSGYYRYTMFKNSVYIVNRYSSGVLYDNKVWKGGGALFSHGCPVRYTDSFTGATSAVVGGLTASKYYFYVMTYLYDDYQESGAMNYVRVDSTGATAILLSGFDTVAGLVSSRVKGFRLYRSEGLTILNRTVPDNMFHLKDLSTTESTFLDLVADDALGDLTPIEDLFNQKRPYGARHAVGARGRVILGNLSKSPLLHSPIASGLITLTVSAGAGLLTGGAYKYRISKAYLFPNNERYGIEVGESVVVTSASVTLKTITIQIATLSSEVERDWCGYLLIERTLGAGTDFYYHSIASIDSLVSGYTDNIPDASLKTGARDSPVDIIRADEVTNNSFTGTIAISELGNGDLFNAESIKTVGDDDSQGISAMFAEDFKVVIFKGNGIHEMDTRQADSTFWQVTQVVAGIGAIGQDTTPLTDTVGHTGVIQLPDGNGYIFFSKASNNSTDEVRVYHYGGQGLTPIGREVNATINGGAYFKLLDMCFDNVNSWVWALIETASGVRSILVYDIESKEWYVFKANSAVLFRSITCTEGGKILVGLDDGRVNEYLKTSFQDQYGGNPYNFTVKIQGKYYQPNDADINGVGVSFNVETDSATTTTGDVIGGIDASEDTAGVATSSNILHKISRRFNLKGKRFYVRYENSENKNITIHKMNVEFKIEHKEGAGK